MTEPGSLPPSGSVGAGKILALAAAMILVFIVVAVILLRVLPGPRKDLDYLVVGTLATVASLAILFVILITTWIKSPDVFFRKRRK